MKAKEFITEQETGIVDAVRDFLPIAIKTLKLKQLPKITFSKDVESKHDQPTFGVYHHDKEHKLIEIDIEERHPIDIIRTLAHELVHYRQDLDGRLTDKSWHTGSPTEDEAHEKAGVMMRIFDKKYPQYLKMQAIQFENFADGKVKGKSRPGRVKRAGASCSGSVTSLRQKAKQGGERGKMYHWCANMKRGRNK